MQLSARRGAAATTLLCFLSACSGPAPGPVSPAPLVDIAIPFEAVVGQQPFACGTSYPGLGATGSTITPTDLRLFVSDVHLIDRRGRAVPLQAGAERTWTYQGTTLLDFENGTGPCANGSPETNTVIMGKAPAGDYDGVRFTVGVPFALNHLDHNRQPAPLNVTSMFWAWRSGYKFLRFEFRTSGPAGALFVHLGSTGCVVDSAVSPLTKECGQSNRAVVELRGLTPGREVIALDVAALVAGANLDENQPQTARGCMSAPNDNDCAPLFANLGMPFGNHAAGAQRVFRVARGVSASR